MSKSAPIPFPITIITGFLGSGKTTLLNRLLHEDAFRETLVMINEFGEIGLDHLLIEHVNDDLILLSSGCICCSVRGDLIAKLEDLLKRVDNQRMPPFQRVIIETTGLADPAPILNAIFAHPYLKLRYSINGLVTVVDAVHGSHTLKHHPEAMKQVAMADCLLITKTDLLSEPNTQNTHAELLAQLQSLNPVARSISLHRDETSFAQLAEHITHLGPWGYEGKNPHVRQWLGDHADPHGHQHEDAHPHLHQHHHHHHIQSCVIVHDQPLHAHQLDLFLEWLLATQGAKLLRIKGIVALSDDLTRPLLVQGVQHMLHPFVRLPRWPDADQTTRLVLIIEGADPVLIRSLWKAFTGQVQVDTPDQQAITQNPLVLQGF
jgi:G3E family GTPase